MDDATKENLAQEYRRLLSERSELSASARKTGDATPQERERLSEVSLRIREIVAIPPQGYELPKLAADLVAVSEAHGWLSLVQWTPPGYGGQPYVTVQVGRPLVQGEMPDACGSKWIYKVTWHSYGCSPGKVRLSGRGTAVTPDSPAVKDAPSLKAIRAVIVQHPKPV